MLHRHCALIGILFRPMDAKKIKDIRRRLSSEYESLIKSINRSRLAAKEIKLENTEDEGDLAAISHERELLYNLHESDFAHLRFIQEAMKAMDRGQYGDVSAAAKTSMKNGSRPCHGPRCAFVARKKRRQSTLLHVWCWRAWKQKRRSCNDSRWIRKPRKVFKQTGADDIAWTVEMKNDYANTDRY